jgi:signal transduction histidine kinase
MPQMIVQTTDGYAGTLAQLIISERWTLANAWLTRLRDLLTVEPNDVFPSDDLLDHIPSLIAEIAAYLRAPADEEIAANAAVIDKARELGMLRHEQKASVHQVLREYEILGELLETFVVTETERLELQPSAADGFELLRRLTRSIRTLLRTTVETFISQYTTTIQERNERIKAFNQMASHELRSPLGTLTFAATLLNTEVVQSDAQRLAKIASVVRSNVERLSWLVENMQRLARLDGALDLPNQQYVELSTLATEVVRQLEDMAAAKGVTIRVAPGLPALLIDPARVELVLLNLVSNAIKYSDPSKTSCFVEIGPAAPDETQPRSCVICVRDNGVGIPENQRDAVFDRFFRAHAHLDGELGVTGTGLGLAIVAECVQALGGTIRCESVVAEGTAFFITLPFQHDVPAGAGARVPAQ